MGPSFSALVVNLGRLGTMKSDKWNNSDTFVGYYATEYIRQKRLGEWDIDLAVARACKAAARTIQHVGAQESIPWSDEIDEQGADKPDLLDQV